MKFKLYVWVILGLTYFASGCGHKPAPFIPFGADHKQISADQLADVPDQSRLQVMIINGGCIVYKYVIYSCGQAVALNPVIACRIPEDGPKT